MKSIFNFHYKEGILISSQKIVFSLVNTLIILKILSLGGEALGAAIAISINILSNLLISTISPLLYTNPNRIKIGFLVPYLVMGLSVFSLAYTQLPILYIPALLIYLAGYSIYYSAYFSIRLENDQAISLKLSKLEKIGGFSWIIGLLIGAISTIFLDIDNTIIITSIFPFIGFTTSVYLMKASYLKTSDKIHENLCYDTLKKENNLFNYKIHSKTRELFLVNFLIQFSNALASTQLIPYLAINGYSLSEIFLFSLVSSCTATITYEKAGKKFDGVFSILKAIQFRILVFLILMIILALKLSNILFYIAILGLSFALLGRSWAYLYINLNSFIINLKSKEISYINLAGSLGNIIGIYISSYLLLYFSYPLELLTSILTMSIPFLLIYSKSNTGIRRHIPIPRFGILH